MKRRIPIIIGLILLCLATWLQMTKNPYIHPLLERLNNLGYDLQLRAYVLQQSKHPKTPVAIIDIDDRSLAKEGRWPWPRNKVSDLVQRISEHGAAVIAFDMFFSEKQPNIANEIITKMREKKTLTDVVETALKENTSLFDEDANLAKTLSANAVVLAVSFLQQDIVYNDLPKPTIKATPEQIHDLNIRKALGYINNTPVIENASSSNGFINVYSDNDGIIRRAPLLMKYNNNFYPSLSLATVMLFLTEEVSLVSPVYDNQQKLEGIQMGTQVIPVDERGQVLIPFIGKSFTFPYYSATDVLNNKIPDDALLGKIVFIGTSATGLGDLQTTAIQTPFPGVEIHASIVNGMLQEGFSYVPAWTLGANLVLTIILGLIASFLFPYLGPRTSALIIVAFPGLVLIVNNYQWERTGLVLSLLMPVILVIIIALFNILYGYLFETRKRERLKEMFGQYVPEKHIDEMIKDSGNLALRGEDREMSVLFADIRSFTTISEGLSASELVEMLNTFFTPMTEIIFKHRGTIDKYVGDLIMAFWGAPLKDKHHARRAIISALEMQAKVKDLAPLLAEHKWPEIHIGIGINSGVMSVGDMGSVYRRNYTVLGDAVNLASRVESLSKFYGVDIIVTENTAIEPKRFLFRKLDKVRVKGKKLGVEILEVISLKKNAKPEVVQEVERYHTALSLYFKQQWDQAEAMLKQLHEEHPDTKIYKLYLERIAEFKTNPPPQDWDGVYIHQSK